MHEVPQTQPNVWPVDPREQGTQGTVPSALTTVLFPFFKFALTDLATFFFVTDRVTKRSLDDSTLSVQCSYPSKRELYHESLVHKKTTRGRQVA